MKRINCIMALTALAGAGLTACSESDLLTDTGHSMNNAIKFAYNLPANGTRTVLNKFPKGAEMAVDGFQTTEKGEKMRLFKNTKVTKIDESNWTYDDMRYWDINSTYAFYAMYPHAQAHDFDESNCFYSINDFTVADNKDDQEDVMIAEEKKAMPENLVTFNFNHLLSQVNFYLKAGSDFDMSGVESIELKSFDLTGIKNTGSYAQTGWNSVDRNVVGKWTIAENSGEYDFPEVTAADPVVTANTVSPIETGLLLLPQALTDAKASVSYRINYQDGSASSFTTVVKLPSALITKSTDAEESNNTYVADWKPNHIYRYNLAVNPSKRSISDFGVDYDGTINGDGVPNPGTTLVVDSDKNWWVDTNGDGIGDIPIVWEDIDGDGNLEGGIDRDGDGHIDNVDGENENPTNNPLVTDGNSNNPGGKDVILVDTNGDGVCDTQLERKDEIGPDKPLDQYTVVDWDGSKNMDGKPEHTTKIVVDENGTPIGILVDEDGDGTPETQYPVAWEDLDGDGKEELGVDRDGDGKIDNVDGENENHATVGTKTYDNVSDSNSNNPHGRDVILVDNDGDGIAETQIERTTTFNPDPQRDMQIKFSAEVENFHDETDADITTGR